MAANYAGGIGCNLSDTMLAVADASSLERDAFAFATSW